MKKSKIETADTRKRIVATASKLFLERGLAETCIADVMLAIGLTQGGFYRHFESKDQLVAEANRAANTRLFAYYADATAGKPAAAALDIIVDLYLHQNVGEEPSLCPLANLGSELRHANDDIRNVAMEGYAGLVSTFTALSRQLGVVDYASVGDAIVSTLVGAVTLSRLAVDAAAANAILDNAQHTVAAMVRAAPAQRALAA